MTKIVLRTLVIALLAELPKSKTEQFNKAFELYRKSPHKNLGVERRLNMAGFTEDGLKNLLYDLKQLHQISDVEVKNYKKETTAIGELSKIEWFITQMSKDQLKEWMSNGCEGTKSTIDELIQFSQEEGKEDLTISLIEAKQEFEADNYRLNDDPNLHPELKSSEPTDEAKSIREEYPFLNDKDCPEELLIVVGKKIGAWKRYQELHAMIQNFDVEKDGEQALTKLTAEATAEYEDNQALDLELKHYADNKEVLAAHPSLVEFRIKKEVETMSNDELHKFVQSSKTFFSRVPKDLEKFKDDAEKIADIKKKAADRELKLTLVKNKLGIN